MFGLHLWARPFLHPSPTPGSTAPGVDSPAAVPRHPAAAFGAPGYLLPHLTSDKSSVSSGMPFNPSSLLLYRPGGTLPASVSTETEHGSLEPAPSTSRGFREGPAPGVVSPGWGRRIISFRISTDEAGQVRGAREPRKTWQHQRDRKADVTPQPRPVHRELGTPCRPRLARREGSTVPRGDGRSSAGVRSPNSSSGRRPDTEDHLSDHERNSYGKYHLLHFK